MVDEKTAAEMMLMSKAEVERRLATRDKKGEGDEGAL